MRRVRAALAILAAGIFGQAIQTPAQTTFLAVAIEPASTTTTEPSPGVLVSNGPLFEIGAPGVPIGTLDETLTLGSGGTFSATTTLTFLSGGTLLLTESGTVSEILFDHVVSDGGFQFQGSCVVVGGSGQYQGATGEGAIVGLAVFDESWFVGKRFQINVTLAARACPRTPGFWKNHPGAWPVTSLVLGTTSYGVASLRALLRTPPKHDASVILARQLIAARLNVASGSDPAPVAGALAEADALLSALPPLAAKVRPSSPTGQALLRVAATLDAYNNGLLTPECE